MKSLNNASKKIFFKLIDIMYGSDCLEIENKPFLNLVIERMGKDIKTPHGTVDVYSLRHGYEQDEHLMILLEMFFIIVDNRKGDAMAWASVNIFPYKFHKTVSKIMQVGIPIENGWLCEYDKGLQEGQLRSADKWIKDIEQQGYLDEVPF